MEYEYKSPHTVANFRIEILMQLLGLIIGIVSSKSEFQLAKVQDVFFCTTQYIHINVNIVMNKPKL